MEAAIRMERMARVTTTSMRVKALVLGGTD